MGYNKKDEYTLSYQEGVKRLRQEARFIGDRILNEAIAAWADQHTEGKTRGKVLELIGREDIIDYFRRGSRKALGR